MRTRFFITAVVLISTSTPALATSAPSDVLYIGDSHSVATTLRTELQSGLGGNVSYYASCGSNAAHWAKGGYSSKCGNYNANVTPSMETLMLKHKPDKVIIELGDNHFEWEGAQPRRAKKVSDSTEKYVKALLSRLDDTTPCYWVGPTWGSRGSSYFKSDEMTNKMYEVLKKAIEPRCTIVDCRNAVSKNSIGDGLHHHNDEASKNWANCIIEKTSVPDVDEESRDTTIEN